MRPAKKSDLDLVHERLMTAIMTSEYYSDEFKAYEAGRLSKAFLCRLSEIDPRHVLLPLAGNEPAGFMISGPELGTLWLYWSFIAPEYRRSTIAMKAVHGFIDHWDNDRFHKVSTYVKPDNLVAGKLMERYKFARTCVLEQHIFGEDYVLYERRLNKAIPGYDHGLSMGMKARLRFAIRSALKL